MKPKIKRTAGLVLLAVLLLAGIVSAQTSTNFDAAWARFASGGGLRQSANNQAQDIVGQWVAQSPASANAKIVTDFYWAGDRFAQQVYLPILARP